MYHFLDTNIYLVSYKNMYHCNMDLFLTTNDHSKEHRKHSYTRVEEEACQLSHLSQCDPLPALGVLFHNTFLSLVKVPVDPFLSPSDTVSHTDLQPES